MRKPKDPLKKIIGDIRDHAFGNNAQKYLKRIPKRALTKFSDRVAKIDDGKYVYKDKQCPDFKRRSDLKFSSSDKPTNLPEAFIWKQSNWKKYKKFRDWYDKSKVTTAPKNRVVHFAFAKHLQSNGEKPIFDQHSCRAVMAIFEPILDENFEDMESYLFIGEKWRGDKQPKQHVGLRTVKLFEECIAEIALQKHYWDLDCLLMPLGQALKKTYVTKKRFYADMKISL